MSYHVCGNNSRYLTPPSGAIGATSSWGQTDPVPQLLNTFHFTTVLLHYISLFFFFNLKNYGWDWREGSAVKNNCCSFRRPSFCSQYPDGGSQPSLSPGPGDLTSLLASVSTNTHGAHACMWANTPHKKNTINISVFKLWASNQYLT